MSKDYYSFEMDIEDIEALIAEINNLKAEVEMAEKDADYYCEKMIQWRERANRARNLARDLALILKAIKKNGNLSLKWADESASKWHNLPAAWREYILHG